MDVFFILVVNHKQFFLFLAHFQALFVDNFGILELFQVLIADTFGILALFQVLIAENFGIFYHIFGH